LSASQRFPPLQQGTHAAQSVRAPTARHSGVDFAVKLEIGHYGNNGDEKNRSRDDEDGQYGLDPRPTLRSSRIAGRRRSVGERSGIIDGHETLLAESQAGTVQYFGQDGE
jgi:hypothetical protein